ncbi:hypothetical protein BDZ97DRAFT_1925263 [Flammula alnicola]|nr:hypothetical protein BDZ97DRAFT_1925263 [Flammula alnicola]
MPHNLYVLKQGLGPNSLFKNHWALFVHISGDPAEGNAVGTYIHVTGSVAEGFTFEVKRNWSQALTIVHRFFLIGQVTDESVAMSPPAIGDVRAEDQARTLLERALLMTPPPGPSLRRGGGGGPVELRDCQWWIGQALPYAVEDGHVQLRQDATQILDVSNQ